VIKRVSTVTLYGYIGSGNIGNHATFETVTRSISTRYPEI
jgi:polysaccharide pyruvyl transferase WcaK-like protein